MQVKSGGTRGAHAGDARAQRPATVVNGQAVRWGWCHAVATPTTEVADYPVQTNTYINSFSMSNAICNKLSIKTI